jgi:hypothetical protein
MSLATLTFVPDTPVDFQRWSFSNQASHRDIIRVIKQNQVAMTPGFTLTPVNEYLIDPFDPDNLGNWPYLHQVMHNQMFQAAGLPASYDLTGIDWQDPQVVQNWISAHADDHNRISAFLGLS